MAELILFDLDDTLIDHQGAALAAITGMVARFPAAQRPGAELADRWSTLTRRHLAEFLAGECSFAEQRRRRLRGFLPLLGESVPEDAVLDAWFAEHYLPAYEAAWRIHIDVRPCLSALACLPTTPRRAVLTNGDARQQRAKLDRFGLLDAFDAVLTPADLGVAKPDPACFTLACRRLSVDPGAAISVGDWLEGDAVAAAHAGLTGIWLDRGAQPLLARTAVSGGAAEAARSAGKAGTSEHTADAGPVGDIGRAVTRITSLQELPALL